MSHQILLVDDSRVRQHMIRHILKKNGYTVTVAGDGTEALPILQSEPIDLLISDIEMPEMDGFALVEAVRDDAVLSELPVIMVTATGEETNYDRATELGVKGFLTVPFNSADFIGMVAELLEAKSSPPH